MKRIILILILIFKITFFVAQEKGILTGKITDKRNNKEIDDVAAIIIKQKGNTIVNQLVGLDNAIYNFSLTPGIYEVEIFCFNYDAERAKIEIISGETTILDFQLNNKALKKYSIGTVFDTVNIKAIEVDSLNIRIKVMLDNHIRKMKKVNKNKHCIVVRLWTLNDNCIDKNEVDSICSLFVKGYFGHSIGYNIKINTYRNHGVYIYGITNWKKTFYYNYRGWDVVFITTLNIDFPNSGNIKELQFNLKYKDRVEKANGKNFFDIDERKIKNEKKYEWKGTTTYYLFDSGVDYIMGKSKELYNKKMQPLDD